MEKFFSIIVPIYNVEKYLENCIDSVLNQTFTDLELVLVDDGSPDKCPQICDEYAKKDNRIKVLHKENGGVSEARNAGLELAGGRYVLFIDSDDALSYNDALSDIKNELEKKEYPDVLLTRYSENEFEDGILGEDLIRQMMSRALSGKRLYITVWDKIYKREFLLKNNLFFKEGLVHEDLIWICHTLDNAKRCEFIDKEFYWHNEVDASITRSRTETSILKRATSKLQVAKTNMDYFGKKDGKDNKYTDIYEFFVGVYIAGIIESRGLKEKSSKKYFNDILRKTSNVMNFGMKTKRADYKLLAMLNLVFGIKAVKLIGLLKK